MQLPDSHLDLGCGDVPRNPYGRKNLCGVDVRGISPSAGFEFRPANLFLDPIPFADNSFASVSAFDFIEHVPRVLTTPDGRDTFFPFIRLMNEVWRVLAPGGTLYALTPTYPSPDVFVDPTHVNVITDHTHEYFCGERPFGRMYGFKGRFSVKRAEWVRHSESLVALSPVAVAEAKANARRKKRDPLRILASTVRETSRLIRGKPFWRRPPERLSHFLWELEAIKDGSST